MGSTGSRGLLVLGVIGFYWFQSSMGSTGSRVLLVQGFYIPVLGFYSFGRTLESVEPWNLWSLHVEP